MVVKTEHKLAYRGKTIVPGGVSKDFVRCECGIRITYEFGKENPWDLMSTHIKEMGGEEKPPVHEYNGTYSINGLVYVRCTCGWQKKLKATKEPRNVWEGHRGFFENKERKETRQTSSTNHKSYSGNNKSWWKGSSWTSGYRKASWEEIEPIANEIFGGTFFVVSVNAQ